jgi:hypothetical protein
LKREKIKRRRRGRGIKSCCVNEAGDHECQDEEFFIITAVIIIMISSVSFKVKMMMISEMRMTLGHEESLSVSLSAKNKCPALPSSSKSSLPAFEEDSLHENISG